jgi:hypothetical protein
VEFRTQDEDADPATSQDAAKLVAAAQAVFQISGVRFPHSSGHLVILHMQRKRKGRRKKKSKVRIKGKIFAWCGSEGPAG